MCGINNKIYLNFGFKTCFGNRTCVRLPTPEYIRIIIQIKLLVSKTYFYLEDLKIFS